MKTGHSGGGGEWGRGRVVAEDWQMLHLIHRRVAVYENAWLPKRIWPSEELVAKQWADWQTEGKAALWRDYVKPLFYILYRSDTSFLFYIHII